MLRKLVNFLLRTLGTPGEHHLLRPARGKKESFERRWRTRRRKKEGAR